MKAFFIINYQLYQRQRKIVDFIDILPYLPIILTQHFSNKLGIQKIIILNSKIVLLPNQINQRLLSPSQKISFFSCLIFTSHFSITHHHIFISHFTENTQVFFLLYVHHVSIAVKLYSKGVFFL